MSGWKLTTLLLLMAAILGWHTCHTANCGPETTTLDWHTKRVCEIYPVYSKCPKVKPSDCLNGVKNVDCQPCYEGTYIGDTSKTASGLTCQAWNVQTPHKHEYARLGQHNHCRNPDGKSGVWCYTSSPEKRWEECDVRECNSCDKDFSNSTFCSSYPNGHTLIYYAGGPSEECTTKTLFRGFTEADKNMIVKIHNELRQKVASGQESHGNQPGASNMMKLVWNDELAATAQRWVDQCKGGHDKVRNMCGGKWVGQNSYVKLRSWQLETKDEVYAKVEKAIRYWYAEVGLGGGFPSSNIKPFKYEDMYGHYTAVVWATTAEIGCGLAYYKDYKIREYQFYKTHIVCNYAVGGNHGQGKTQIYKVGKGCSDCPKGTTCDQTYDSLCAGRCEDYECRE